MTPPPLLMFTTTSTTEAPYVHNLKHVLHLSLLFFEAQRSGKLPMDNRVQWRKGTDYLIASWGQVLSGRSMGLK